MYLVDTSVLIDVLNGQHNAKTRLFDRLEDQKAPYGITPYTYFELVQGTRSDGAVKKLTEYLAPVKRYWLPQADSAYRQAAELYRRCRKAGVTPRSSIDILIVQTALHYDLELLHNDNDFDHIKTVVDELRIAV
jgi:predicted nucleic acid-binding protein